MLSPRTFALLIGVFANSLAGATYLGQKIALDAFPPATVVFLRTLIATPLLFACSPRGWIETVTPADWWRLAIVGVFGLAAPHLVGIYGLEHTESINAALLVGMEPVAIVLLSALVLKERASPGQIAGIAISVLGATVIVAKGDLLSIGSDASSRGNLLLALSGMLWAIYTIAAKPTLGRVSPLAVTAVTSAISLFILGPPAMIEMGRGMEPPSMLAVWSVIGLGVGVSFAATALWNVSLRAITPTQMAALIFLQPLAGTVLGALAGEPMPLSTMIGGAILLAGVYVVQR